MNSSAIYSKSGKGVQEASGKTSNLSRADRAVLSAFDGRLTVKDVAERVGKSFDANFEKLVGQLDRDGYIREVSSGTPSVQGKPPAGKPAAAPAKPAGSGGGGGGGADLDFTIAIPAAPAPKAPPKAATMTAAAAAKAESDKKVSEDAMTRARREAEERQQKERDKVKAEAEAKLRAETEAKMRSEAAQKAKEAEARAKKEAEEKIKAEAEAKIKAAREAERKAKEEADRVRREAEEKARKEAAEMQRKLDEERRAREEAERARQEAERKAREAAEKARLEAERKAKEEAERARREAEEKARREAAELQRKLDEERRAREEAERRAKEEAERARKAAETKAREDAERQAREQAERSQREEEERRSAAADAAADAERMARELIDAQTAQAEQQAKDKEKAAPKGDAGGGSFDSLLADLDSFSDREDEDKKAKEEAERKAKEEKARRQREDAEAKARDDAERRKRDADELERKLEEEKKKEEAQRKAREEEEAREAEERKAEERKRKRREEAQAKEAGAEKGDDIGVSDDDLGMDDVKADQEAVSKESRKAQRAREKEAKEREREARERAREAKREEKRATAAPAAPPVGGYRPIRRKRSWGKPIALTLFVLLAGGIGYLHVMPINTQDYEKAASDAIGRPVKIGVARLSVYRGLVLSMENISIGDARIGNARAFPDVGALFDEKKTFSRIELDGATLPQQAVGAFLDVKLRNDKFYVGRVLVNKLKLDGPLILPTFEAEASVGPQGSISKIELRGPDNLMAKLTPAGNDVEFEATASGFPLPFLPDVTLSTFAMKGRATRDSARIDSWGGATMGGAVNGSASVRWGSSWSLDGQMTLRGINAAVFAPALLSEGNAEGTARFSMSESDPSKFKDRGRVDGNFLINRGVLGSFDLSRAILTGGRQATGRTPFIELTGQGAYDRGAVTLRNVTFSAGQMNATANADISPEGALSGRIVADIKTSAQQLRATINVGGTVREPQVK